MSALAEALADAGGARAPRERHARLRALLAAALVRGEEELARPRSGYGEPVEVVLAAGHGVLLAAAPVPASLRADPTSTTVRGLTLLSGLVEALAVAADLPPPARAGDLALRAADEDGFLALSLPTRRPDVELAVLAFDEAVGRVDRLRAVARAVPGALLEATDWREPIGADHPLRAVEAIARLGGRLAEPGTIEALDDALPAVLGLHDAASRPHEDPDPARRAARRIVQRLAGMGKWGGYHTAWDHLARGFRGNDRELAYAVGEALLAAGLLEEKPSVGQRHVFLNPRRAGDIHRLMEDGTLPTGLVLP